MSVRTFEDLRVWKMARKFRQRVYKTGEHFPKDERYNLTSQIRDAAVSITANIAEGFGRYHFQENIQCCRIARGSTNEVLNHLYTSLDAGYISEEEFDSLYKEGREVEKALNGYIGFLHREAATRKQ